MTVLLDEKLNMDELETLSNEISGFLDQYEDEFEDNYFLDDGAFLATRIVVRAAKLFHEGKRISSVIADLSEPAQSIEVRLPITSPDFAATADAALAAVRAFAGGDHGTAFADGLHFSIVTPNYEGIRVQFEGDVNGWFLLRKSLHDPILPMNIESREPGGTDRIRHLLKGCLSAVDGVDTAKLD